MRANLSLISAPHLPPRQSSTPPPGKLLTYSACVSAAGEEQVCSMVCVCVTHHTFIAEVVVCNGV